MVTQPAMIFPAEGLGRILSAAGQGQFSILFCLPGLKTARMSSAHGSMSFLQPLACSRLSSRVPSATSLFYTALGMRCELNRRQDRVPCSVAWAGSNSGHDRASGAGVELVSSLRSFCSRAPCSPEFRLLFGDGISCQPVNLSCHIWWSAFPHGVACRALSLHEISLGACVGREQHGPTPHDHITEQWNVCPARARRVRRERDLSLTSHIESQADLILVPSDNGLPSPIAHLRRPARV